MARDSWAATPLHKAALCGHAAVVELLLVRCAPSLTAQDVTGCVPIHLAASAGHTGVSVGGFFIFTYLAYLFYLLSSSS